MDENNYENIKNIKKYLKENERKNIIDDIITERKIFVSGSKYKSYKSYIKLNNPTLEELLNLFSEDDKKKEKRLKKLLKKLKENDVKYDEDVPIFIKYLKEGGDVDDIIDDAKLEISLINSTRYREYLKTNSIEVARYLASVEYMNNENKSDNDVVKKFVKEKNTIYFR